MDVVNVEQAKIAEAAGAVAVMALERIPADIRYDGGVARMSDPAMILQIKNAVTIPVMAKVMMILMIVLVVVNGSVVSIEVAKSVLMRVLVVLRLQWYR